MGPTVSVVVPVYNPGRHLEPCIDSIAGQTHSDLQVLLVDDGSSDGSAALCDERAFGDERFTCVHQRNGGVSKARNAGLELANGDWYHFPDSDDYLEPDAYEYLIGLAREHSCDMVNFEYYGTYPDHEDAHLLADRHYGLMHGVEIHRTILEGEPFAWNKLFSRELVVGDGDSPGIRFREDIARGEDSLFAHEAAERADGAWFDGRPVYHYVQSEESAVRGRFRPSQLSAMLLYDAYKPLYREGYPELLPRFLVGMLHLLIMIYYDMWADAENYTAQQRRVYQCCLEHIEETVQIGRPTKKELLKFTLFRISPSLFCLLHKSMHRL